MNRILMAIMALVLPILAACGGADSTESRLGAAQDAVTTCTLPSQATVTPSVTTWGSDPAQLVAVYAPSGTANAQPVVMVHGGGWTSGSATTGDAAGTAKSLVTKGYVVFSAGYRLAPATTGGSGAVHPAQVSDVRCAVRFAAANASSYGADPAHLIVLGGSAGGHLAALSALTAIDDGTCPWSTTVSAAGIAAWSGVYDLTGTGGSVPTQAALLLGYTPSSNPTGALAASPISYVGSSQPPLWLAHWSSDATVPSGQMTSFSSAASSAGESVTSWMMSGSYHEPSLFLPLFTIPSGDYLGCNLLSWMAAR